MQKVESWPQLQDAIKTSSQYKHCHKTNIISGGVWKSGKPESGIGTGIGTGTGTGTGMGRETYIKAGTTFTLI